MAFKTVICFINTMPEGSEVLRITQRLDSGMASKTLTQIEFHVESYRNKQFRGDPTAVSNFLSELSEGLEVNRHQINKTGNSVQLMTVL